MDHIHHHLAPKALAPCQAGEVVERLLAYLPIALD
jgi:hypothetical protein